MKIPVIHISKMMHSEDGEEVRLKRSPNTLPVMWMGNEEDFQTTESVFEDLDWELFWESFAYEVPVR